MAHKGQILDNPITGERIHFLDTAADTDGALLRFELTVIPGGHVPGLHVHPTQEESFEILSGSMKFRKGFRTVHAKAGETVVVPPRTIHKFSNAGSEPVRAIIEVRPALKMEELLETSHALAVNGRTNRKGMPKPLDLALFMRTFRAEVQAPFAPPSLVGAVMAPVAALAGWRGIDHAGMLQPGVVDAAVLDEEPATETAF